MKHPIKVFSDWVISGKDEGMKDNHFKPVMKMIELFENKYENPSIIDAGCGNGWLIRHFYENKRYTNLSGVDGSREMIAKAKTLDNQKIPKLSELFELSSKYKSENLLINLEIKSTPDEENLTPTPEEMVKLVMQEVNKSNLQNKIIISSFDWRTLTEIKNHYPEISRAYLSFQQQTGIKIKNTIYNRSPWMSFLPFFEKYELPKIIKSQGGKAWHPYHKDITKKLVEISHQEDLPVNVWTVNEEYDMLKMIEYSVDGIMTDYPLRLKELCDKENINWF